MQNTETPPTPKQFSRILVNDEVKLNSLIMDRDKLFGGSNISKPFSVSNKSSAAREQIHFDSKQTRIKKV